MSFIQAYFSCHKHLVYVKAPKILCDEIKREINVFVAYMHILGTNLDFIDEVKVFKQNFSVYIASFSLEIDKINLKPWHLKLMESQSQGFVWKFSWEQEKWPSVGQKGSSNIIGGAGWHEDPSPPPSASF